MALKNCLGEQEGPRKRLEWKLPLFSLGIFECRSKGWKISLRKEKALNSLIRKMSCLPSSLAETLYSHWSREGDCSPEWCCARLVPADVGGSVFLLYFCPRPVRAPLCSVSNSWFKSWSPNKFLLTSLLSHGLLAAQFQILVPPKCPFYQIPSRSFPFQLIIFISFKPALPLFQLLFLT